MTDPIVEEVRRWRMEHTRKFAGDLTLIYQDLRQIQQASGFKLVRRAPKRVKAAELPERYRVTAVEE